MVRSILLAASLFLAPLAVQAQSHTNVPGTWDVFGGVSVLRTTYSGFPPNYSVPNATVQLPYPTGTPQYDYGWAFSLTQRLDDHPWIGGTIEGSGTYSSTNWTVTPTNGSANYTIRDLADSYTAMAGPVVQLNYGAVRPFGHAMFGAVVVATSLTPTGQASSSYTNDYFGNTLGGGLDFRMARHAGIRVQADYLRVWSQMATNPNSLRMFAGIVLH